jgi:hypothetical protein
LLLVAQLRPVAELGRARIPVDEGESGKRSTWKLEPLAFETLDNATERGRQVLRDNHVTCENWNREDVREPCSIAHS